MVAASAGLLRRMAPVHSRTMQILLTNDDGANATGLEVLERIADGYLSEMPLHLDLADAPSLSGLCA